MEPLKIELIAYDVGQRAATLEALVDPVINATTEAWVRGADVVVFPEYVWMSLEQLVVGGDPVRAVARLFWGEAWPLLQQRLSRPDKAVVLGTAPCELPDGALRNRAAVLAGGRMLHQDKLNLTPWEDVFQGGDTLQVWEFRGATFAVLVCLDIEVPELAVALRGLGVDAILVPSATETLMGLERIGRCASARSVELCCHVGVAHLTGGAASELVDRNIGRAAWFTPSQSAFEDLPRSLATEPAWGGHASVTGEIDLDRLRKSRSARLETNPALIPAPVARNLLVEKIAIS